MHTAKPGWTAYPISDQNGWNEGGKAFLCDAWLPQN